MKMTIYLPDDLAAEVNAKLKGTNISAICQAALREELARGEARTEIAAEGFEHIQVYDSERDRCVAFRGRRIGSSTHLLQTAYLTPKGAIALYSQDRQGLWIYENFAKFAVDEPADELLAEVARAR